MDAFAEPPIHGLHLDQARIVPEEVAVKGKFPETADPARCCPRMPKNRRRHTRASPESLYVFIGVGGGELEIPFQRRRDLGRIA
jgi:hypothetical protein